MEASAAESLIKDINYYATSLVCALTLFTSWRTAKFTYTILQKKRDIRKLENNEVYSVDELKDRGLKLNDVVIVKVKGT